MISLVSMGDQMTELGSVLPLREETIPMKTNKIPPGQDSSISEMYLSQEHKFKKGRRKSGSKKHRAGKNRKRRYKPYYKLTYEEREKADERNEKRANRKREYLHSRGLSLAPPNTTQFLVNDSIEASSLWKKLQDRDHSDASSPSENDDSSVENDDFNVMWNQKRFEDMSHSDLAEWFLSLEGDMEEVERIRREERIKKEIFEEEVKRYEHENEVLINLNAKMLKDIPSKYEKIVERLVEEYNPSTCRGSVIHCKDDTVIDGEYHPLEEDISSADICSAMPCKDDTVVDREYQPFEQNISSADMHSVIPCKDETILDKKCQPLEEEMSSTV